MRQEVNTHVFAFRLLFCQQVLESKIKFCFCGRSRLKETLREEKYRW